jgi:hypothetical protein
LGHTHDWPEYLYVRDGLNVITLKYAATGVGDSDEEGWQNAAGTYKLAWDSYYSLWRLSTPNVTIQTDYSNAAWSLNTADPTDGFQIECDDYQPWFFYFAQESPIFELKSRGADAKAKLIDNEFVILKDSLARKSEVDSIGDGVRKRREELVKNGVLEESSESHYCFTKNHAFSSPSTAASVLVEGESNGRRAWKVKDTGQTYGEWDEARLAE